MRDDFSTATKELLAKRVGFVCCNPECRRPTSGPQAAPDGTVNIGVAAHITAASQGGPRFDATLSYEERTDSSNGIWLCQSCAKLVDNDSLRFDRAVLEAWKRAAERNAAMALVLGGARASTSLETGHAKVERLMPVLLEEMREDLTNNPTTREFVIMKRGWVYNNTSGKSILVYYLDEHGDLEGKLEVLMNLGLIREITYNNVRRFVFEEPFVDYLSGT
jgi:hypothetical protein